MIPGFHHLAGFFDEPAQARLLAWTRSVCREAPLVQPAMPNGTPMSVRVTNAGQAGWWSDTSGGYRYVTKHPATGHPWPSAPYWIFAAGNKALTQVGYPPADFDCVAVNYYDDDAKLGMHVDRSERDDTVPIVSISLGADAVFLMGGETRQHSSERFLLHSGDVCVMAQPARNWFHSVARVLPTMHSPTKRGRVNLTLRRVL